MSPQVPRSGFSLLEVLAVLAGLGFLLYLSGVLLISTIRIRDVSADSLAHQTSRALLIDQFRTDVAEATDAPADLGEWKAGPDCLILRYADGRHVLYRFEGERLWRWEQRAKAAEPNWIPLEPAATAAEFHQSGPQQRRITLRLTSRFSKQPLDVSAALGGDLR